MFVGKGPATLAVHQAVDKAAKSRRAVLLSGAPGTGKRTIADLLHHFAGPESPLEIVRIDSRGRVGEFGEFAYLAPVEQLSLEQQARLPNLVGLGRLILGTRLELGSPQAAAQLSPKLLRWCGPAIALPSLAERIDDLEALATYFLSYTHSRRPISGISAAALDCMRAYAWPGNGTELESILAEALGRAVGPVLEASDLPPSMAPSMAPSVAPPGTPSAGGRAGRTTSPDAEFSLELAQRRAIDKAIRHARGNKRHAARLLGIGKSTLYRKLEQDEEQPS